MLAEWDHGTRLWTLDGFGILRDKTDLIAEREIVELAICDAVAVEIEFIAVGAQDEAAILLGEEPRDPSMVGHRVQLDISPSLANVVFEQPAGCVEGVADRHVDVLMRVVCRGIAADDDVAAGNLKVDADPEQIALKAARMPAFDDNTARPDAIEKPLELLGPFADTRRDRVRGIHVPEGDLKRKLHRIFPRECDTIVGSRGSRELIQRNRFQEAPFRPIPARHDPPTRSSEGVTAAPFIS